VTTEAMFELLARQKERLAELEAVERYVRRALDLAGVPPDPEPRKAGEPVIARRLDLVLDVWRHCRLTRPDQGGEG
jgi:hypothetical protein